MDTTESTNTNIFKNNPVEKTKTNQEGETFCLVCEEPYSESDPRETWVQTVCVLQVMGT